MKHYFTYGGPQVTACGLRTAWIVSRDSDADINARRATVILQNVTCCACLSQVERDIAVKLRHVSRYARRRYLREVRTRHAMHGLSKLVETR